MERDFLGPDVLPVTQPTAVKETQSADPNSCPGLMLSSLGGGVCWAGQAAQWASTVACLPYRFSAFKLIFLPFHIEHL